MAKAKAPLPATEEAALDGATFVETAQDYNFADREPDPEPRGRSVEEDIEGVRARRAAERASKGPVLKRRRVTHYQDAERLAKLFAAGHTHLATPEEIVDWEEAEILPNPAHYATGTTAVAEAAARQGTILPPAPPTKADV